MAAPVSFRGGFSQLHTSLFGIELDRPIGVAAISNERRLSFGSAMAPKARTWMPRVPLGEVGVEK
jgi:hypothetical protein